MTTRAILNSVRTMRKKGLADPVIVDLVNSMADVTDQQMDLVLALLCKGKTYAERVALIDRSLT